MSFVWNEEIKQNIINQLNEQFDSISPIAPAENHSYADSIFSPITTNMFTPINNEAFEVPNYFETTITRTRTIKEIPIHTMAFSDSFETKKPATMSFTFSPVMPVSTYSIPESIDVVPTEAQLCDMDQIINSPNAITISLTPEQRGVAIAKKVTWKDILFEDASLIKNTSFAEAVKKFCSIQVNF